MRCLLEQEVYLIVTGFELWTELPLRPDEKETVSWFLERLMNRLERNGNVVAEIINGDKTKEYDCAAMCRTLLPRFRSDEPTEHE
jgi:hypothetical protein